MRISCPFYRFFRFLFPRKRPSCAAFHPLFAFFGLCAICGCSTPSAFYRSPRPASYYSTHYCFEAPKQAVVSALEGFLQQQNFPLQQHDPQQHTYHTKPVAFERYGTRWQEYGHLVTLRFQIRHSTGPIDLKGLPAWALDGSPPKPPPPPERNHYPNEQAFANAQQHYFQHLDTLTTTMQQGVALAKTWQGCRLRQSTQRTLLHIDAKIRAHKLQRPFYTLDPKSPSQTVPSNRTIEYSILRIIALRIQRARFMPPLLF